MTFDNIVQNKLEFPQNMNAEAKDLISKLLIMDAE